ncbi:AraC family transcriptional regulator [Marinimicrobium locisalis]|uniref:AraC family transcriptional regulator n=1 Tax=Marinimicrobium locisalis TaxID=546022 RepID=UPI00322215AA
MSITQNHAAAEATESQHWAEGVDGDQVSTDQGAPEADDAEAELKRISTYVRSLKSDVVDLNHDLKQMEERILYPSSTKYSVFVSFSSGQFFQLESVKLKLNGKLVATHIYSEKQQNAMLRGGIHRLYMTNLADGDHSATAFFTGIGPGGRSYKRATNIEFEKDANSSYLELAIGDDAVKQEPVFAIKQW